jgi:hypothetical protein
VTVERHVSGIDLIGVEFSQSDRNIIGSDMQTVHPAAVV